MIDDLLISLWFDISASFAHATDADDVSNENLGATKGEFLSFATFFWFEDHDALVVISNNHLCSVELLARLTKSVDIVEI